MSVSACASTPSPQPSIIDSKRDKENLDPLKGIKPAPPPSSSGPTASVPLTDRVVAPLPQPAPPILDPYKDLVNSLKNGNQKGAIDAFKKLNANQLRSVAENVDGVIDSAIEKRFDPLLYLFTHCCLDHNNDDNAIKIIPHLSLPGMIQGVYGKANLTLVQRLLMEGRYHVLFECFDKSLSHVDDSLTIDILQGLPSFQRYCYLTYCIRLKMEKGWRMVLNFLPWEELHQAHMSGSLSTKDSFSQLLLVHLQTFLLENRKAPRETIAQWRLSIWSYQDDAKAKNRTDVALWWDQVWQTVNTLNKQPSARVKPQAASVWEPALPILLLPNDSKKAGEKVRVVEKIRADYSVGPQVSTERLTKIFAAQIPSLEGPRDILKVKLVIRQLNLAKK